MTKEELELKRLHKNYNASKNIVKLSKLPFGKHMNYNDE